MYRLEACATFLTGGRRNVSAPVTAFRLVRGNPVADSPDGAFLQSNMARDRQVGIRVRNECICLERAVAPDVAFVEDKAC